MGFFDSASHNKSAIDARTRQYINAARVDWLRDLGIDLVMGHREGSFVWDLDGSRYLDVLSDGTTFNLGHRNPDVIACLKEHLNDLDIGCQFLPSIPRADLAEELVRNSPAGLNHVHFLPSGSEANDAAIKAAMAATGRKKIVSIEGGFHGVTGMAARATGQSFTRSYGIDTPPDEWAQVPWNDADAMVRALAKGDVAAVIIETIPATLGWPMPGNGYLQAVRDACSKQGALMIVDELQTGLGRCGYLWAIDHWNVNPDIMVMAKGAGGGIYPLGYILMTDEAAAWTRRAPLTMPSTFGGSELGCAVGLQVLRMSKDAAFLADVNKMSQTFRSGLNALQAEFPEHVLEVRQLGMAGALRFADVNGGLSMMTALYGNGVLSLAASYDLSVIQLKPSLLTDDATLDMLVDSLRESIHQCFVEKSVQTSPGRIAQIRNQDLRA